MYRFVADNPGVWAFHCHIDWHLSAGFFATMVEAPIELQKTETVPGDNYEVCKKQGLPFRGNAAGNTKDFGDLSGANDAPPVNNVGYVVFLFFFFLIFLGALRCCVGWGVGLFVDWLWLMRVSPTGR